ncbi:MAG: hypothetical protein OXI26_03070 [bacterium]|nr:hypothetical protein [bacterium]
MTILISVAVGVPCLGVLAFLGMRRIQSLPFARSLALARAADMRGIALQTIIIMVVLLAIAGSVAAVILTRAGEETERLDDSESVAAYGISNETGCRLGGYVWKTTIVPTTDTDLIAAITRARPGWNRASDPHCAPS